MKTIKLENPDYVLKTQQKDNGSNYGLSIGVYKKGEKMPIVGMIVKNNTPTNVLIDWAESQIASYSIKQRLDLITFK